MIFKNRTIYVLCMVLFYFYMIFMKKYILSILLLLAIVSTYVFANVSSLVSVQISWNWLVIGTPGAVSLWTISNAWGPLDYTFSWDNFFWIRDLRWRSQWHYTTIQCDGLYQQWWDWVITWVLFKATSWTLFGWLANDTAINPELQQGSWADITEPKLYFYRNNSWHNWWVTNRYIDYPTITVIVPSGITAWTYRWKITYTLYDMDFVYSVWL